VIPAKVETPETLSCCAVRFVVVVTPRVERPATFNDVSIPTEVNEELTTPLPSVVELNTSMPLIL